MQLHDRCRGTASSGAQSQPMQKHRGSGPDGLAPLYLAPFGVVIPPGPAGKRKRSRATIKWRAKYEPEKEDKTVENITIYSGFI